MMTTAKERATLIEAARAIAEKGRAVDFSPTREELRGLCSDSISGGVYDDPVATSWAKSGGRP